MEDLHSGLVNFAVYISYLKLFQVVRVKKEEKSAYTISYAIWTLCFEFFSLLPYFLYRRWQFVWGRSRISYTLRYFKSAQCSLLLRPDDGLSNGF